MAQNAPGKHHRKGISLVALLRMFPDDATARRRGLRRRVGRMASAARIASPIAFSPPPRTHRSAIAAALAGSSSASRREP